MRLIRVWATTIVLGLAAFGMAGCVVFVPVPIPVGSPFPPIPFMDTFGAGDAAIPDGPPLTNVASLPVDASGEGTIQGAPTGEGVSDDAEGTFVLVLEPVPVGLEPRTTVHVAFDKSTMVYRDGQPLGDALMAMNRERGSLRADPTAAGTVEVQFHIRDGRVFADRLDLSDEYPPGLWP